MQRLVKALNAEKEWLLAALSSIHDEVYFTGPQGRYTYANPAALREFGYASVEGVPVERIVSNLEVLRLDGTPRPLEEAPPLRALKGEVVNDEGQIVRVPRTGELRYRQVGSSGAQSRGQYNRIGLGCSGRDGEQARGGPAEAVEQAQAAEVESRAALAAELEAMKRLHELSTKAIRADDQQTLLEEILDATMALHLRQTSVLSGCSTCNRTRYVSLLTVVSNSGFWIAAPKLTVAMLRLWAAAMARRERVIIEDIESTAYGFLRDPALQIGCRAMQSTPLFKAEGAPLGMLTTHFVSPRRFSQSELRLTDLYARQAGIAVERKLANPPWLRHANPRIAPTRRRVTFSERPAMICANPCKLSPCSMEFCAKVRQMRHSKRLCNSRARPSIQWHTCSMRF